MSRKKGGKDNLTIQQLTKGWAFAEYLIRRGDRGMEDPSILHAAGSLKAALDGLRGQPSTVLL